MNLFSELNIIKLDEVDSTNEYAKRIISKQNLNNPILVIADKQTNGKTTKKTQWYSPKGNLYMTLVLKIDTLEEKFLPQLSFISAISLVEVVKECTNNNNVNVQVKWPNDVLLDEMKLSGILIEKEANFAIIGIGVNVQFHPDRKSTVYPTVALRDVGIDIEKDDLGCTLAKRIIGNMELCIQNGFDKIIEKLKPVMIRLSEEIDFEQNGEMYSGVFSGINKNGGLCLKQKNGEEKVFYSGNMYIYRK